MSETVSERTIERFLKSGTLPKDVTPETMIAASDRHVRALTQKDARRAVALGRALVERARAFGSALELVALRSSGWAELVAGNYGEAEQAYVAARTMVTGDPLSRARIDRVLIDVYMYRGEFREAQRRARMALQTFKRHQAASDVAKTQVNYANLLHRMDRHRDACRLYGDAAVYFEAEGPEFAAALCHYNQANTLVQLFNFPAARELYGRARGVFQKHDQDLHATGCLYGLAWLHMLEGEFRQALLELTECEAEYRRGGHARELVVCQLDRAEVFLGLNLFADARSVAEEVEAHADKLGIHYERAKAAFFQAKAAIGMGHRGAARKALRRAERDFERIGNPGFAAAVELTQALIGTRGQKNPAQIGKIREKFSRSQLPLWEALCDLQILTEWPDDEPALRRFGRSKAVASVPHLLAARHTIQGDREARRGRMSAAVNRWTKAADILDAVRVKLPPVELRSSYFSGRQDPHLRLIDATSESDPDSGAAWSERFKTAGPWSPSDAFLGSSPARQRIGESLSDLASRVTAMSGAIADAEGRRAMVAGAPPAAFQQLQRRLRDQLTALEQPGGTTSESISELASAIHGLSRTRPVVQLHAGRDDIIAFVSDGGETRAHRYPDGIEYAREWLGRWRYQIEFTAATRTRLTAAQVAEEAELLKQFGRWFLPPLEIRENARELLILPEGLLAGVPWAALDDGRGSLVDRYEVILAPSVRHHLRAAEGSARGAGSRVFVGRHDGLTHLVEELATVRDRFAGADLTIHDPSRRSDWPADVAEEVWHYTGHADLRRDNPFYSSLLLEDGPLFAADFRLMHNRVGLVTLAACRTGQHTGLPGEEATGLVRSLLEMGASNVVASHWAVSDLSTSRWIDLFYKHYLGGASAARATRLAARGVREQFPSAYHWAAFSVFGRG